MQLTEHQFSSWDGAALFYRAWLPEKPASRALLLFHRGHEHSGRWAGFVQSLGMSDMAIFAWDQRGHGRSDGERGNAPDLAAVVRDADRFARHVAGAHGIATHNIAVVAASLGGVVATAWVHDYAPPVRALVLAAPAFAVKLYVPLAIPFLRSKERLLPGGQVKSFVRPSMLTGVPAEQRAYASDTLIFPQISVNMLLDLHQAGQRLVEDAPAIHTPTLLLVAGCDWVVRRKPQLDFFKRLGSSVKQMELFANGRHALFHDNVATAVVQTTGRFLEQCFARSRSDDPTITDLGSASRTEFDLLRTPSSLKWRAMRRLVKVGGFFSTGIRLGWRSGFDSGQTLDYVYANRSAGVTTIGRMVDRGYLNAIGWRGIRVRGRHLQQTLTDAIHRTIAEEKPVHILDIAAGAGRYVLETMRALKSEAISAELRDYQQANLDAAASLARSLGIERVTFALADAFDRQRVSSATPRPSIVIVSGLYELFPDNEAITRSLAGIAETILPGGFLIYTCQPWHPQVEFIARALVNREGQPWIMRRRSQAEMDALVRVAGFEKLDQQVDRWGIFTVALARRAAQ